MIEKQFKNLEEQIEIMKYKGLTIDDPDFAKKVLLRENYFFLNGYRYPLMKSMKDKRFLEGATFEELYSIFLFPTRLGEGCRGGADKPFGADLIMEALLAVL